tara:strand:- start:270 stop:1049 length:780 start_codon:yes stop_codon:yes gene_type:complete
MINREQMAEELELRKYIRKAIKYVQNKRILEEKRQNEEENQLRNVIRQLLSETKVPDPEEAPHESTGINVLEDLLKKIIPIIEIDFKKLTTDENQRLSFRAHILQAVKNTLAPAKATDQADADLEQGAALEEEITIDIDDNEDDFIDVRGETETKSEKETEKDDFGLEGEDETGRDMAFDTFKRVEGNIVGAWDILYSDKDKELFFDYLITNLKLYFDKFEDELKTNLPEPTTPEYEQEKEGGEEELGGEEDLDLEDQL